MVQVMIVDWKLTSRVFQNEIFHLHLLLLTVFSSCLFVNLGTSSLGRCVRTLIKHHIQAGLHAVCFSSEELGSIIFRW